MLLYKHVALKFEALRIMFLNHVILRFFFTDVFFNSPLMYKKKNVYFTLKWLADVHEEVKRYLFGNLLLKLFVEYYFFVVILQKTFDFT